MAEPPRAVWRQRIVGAICLLVFFGIFGTIIFGQMQRQAIDLWYIDPRLWHTHPLTQPIEMVVYFVVSVLAVVVGSIVSWWSKNNCIY